MKVCFSNIHEFIICKVYENRKDASVFFKIRRKLFYIIALTGSLCLLPVILVIRCLRPLLVIRFGELRCEKIGHFSANTELYLCERDAGMHEKNVHDIFYMLPPVSNYQLKKMWERKLNISVWAYYLALANSCLPKGQLHIAPTPPHDVDVHDLLRRTPVHLSFTEEEEKFGEEQLVKMGITPQTPFVCFIGRDETYMQNFIAADSWGYHDYRNMDIQNFKSAVSELVQRGYTVIRMGHFVKEAFSMEHPKVIDYATKYRTDFLDVYLCAKCQFFINGMSGLDSISFVNFRIPTLQVNFVPIGQLRTWCEHSLCIPKKLWLVQERRFMTFREIFNSEVYCYGKSQLYEEAGIEAIENTEDEIASAVKEFDDRLNGVWQTTEEDEILQERFRALFKHGHHVFLNTGKSGVFRIRIGAEFLRQNAELLE